MNASRALQIGLIGASRVATYAVIAPARNLPGVRVAGIAARDRKRADEYATAHGIGQVYASYAELIGDPAIDLVYVATPPALHAEQALMAIAARKPVLVEKPFAMSAADAQRVFEAGKAARVPVFEAMHSPHHRLFGRILEIVAAGEIGKVRRIEAEFAAPIDADDPIRWNANLGGGALMDLGVYPLTWCRRVAGETFTVERAEGEFRHGVDASFAARLAFAGGVTADVRSSMIVKAPAARLFIEGEHGTLEAINPLAPQMGHVLNVTVRGEQRSETVEGRGTWEAQLEAVRATLQDGAAFPFPADDYVRSMEAIERVRDALHSNRRS